MRLKSESREHSIMKEILEKYLKSKKEVKYE